MDNWDPQMMLDLYIHNYLLKKNMHNTAATFAREANFYPKAVAIDPAEGFLSEWWSIFWSVYSAKFPMQTDATEDYSTKGIQNADPFMPSPDINYMLQDICPSMQMPGFPNWLRTVNPSTLTVADVGNFLQSDLSTTMPTPELGFPFSNFSMMYGNIMQNLIAPTMHEQEHHMLPVGDLNSSAQLLNVDQIACGLPSLGNFSQPQEKIYKNPQLSITKAEKCGTSVWRSTPFETSPHPTMAIQLGMKSADTDSRMREQEHLRLPVRNLNSKPQLLDVDQLACLLPSPSYYSHSQEKFHNVPVLSVTRIQDDKYGSCLKRSAAEPMHQLNIKPAETGFLDTYDNCGTSLKRSAAEAPHQLKIKPAETGCLDACDKCGTSMKRSAAEPMHQLDIKPAESGLLDAYDKGGTSLKRPAAEPTHQLNIKPAETDARMHEQQLLKLSVRNSNPKSQLPAVDQCAPSLPTSSNFGQPQKNKKRRLSIAGDEKRGTSLRPPAAEPNHYEPKAIKSKTKGADTGSSTSSNPASSD